MNMKKILAMLLALCMVLSLAACGAKTETPAAEAAPAATEKAPAAAAAPEAAPEVKDTVIIAIGDEPSTLDPTQGWGHGNTPIIQSTLVSYAADMTFQNDLATEYSLSEDGLVWTFKIREDAYFTDGEQVTAHDVAFTLETAKAAQGSIDLTFMDSAVATDDFTVVITLNTPHLLVPEHHLLRWYRSRACLLRCLRHQPRCCFRPLQVCGMASSGAAGSGSQRELLRRSSRH